MSFVPICEQLIQPLFADMSHFSNQQTGSIGHINQRILKRLFTTLHSLLGSNTRYQDSPKERKYPQSNI